MAISRHRQQGITMISLAALLGLLAFFVLLLLTLLPSYLENFKVRSHLENLKESSETLKMTDQQIINTLFRRFQIDDIENVKEEDVLIEEVTGGIKVTIAYEVRKHVMANVDVVMNFNESVEIK
jgi:hypothetical protein